MIVYYKHILKKEDYKKYITNKNKLNNNIKKFYNNILFRKLNYRRYIRTKQIRIKFIK